MIKNTPTKSDSRTDLQRADFEHRATWMALLINAAMEKGLDESFAHEAILKCGMFHGDHKFTKTEDLQAFSKEFANPDVINTFEMDVFENDGKKLSIDFHYCPLVKAWQKLGLPEDEMPMLCDIAMDGDRGIISTFPKFEFELGKTIAKGDDVCEIRISKHD